MPYRLVGACLSRVPQSAAQTEWWALWTACTCLLQTRHVRHALSAQPLLFAQLPHAVLHCCRCMCQLS
jgi:hypothetical protein